MKKILIFLCLFSLTCLNAVIKDFTKENYIFFLNDTKIPDSELGFFGMIKLVI